MTPSNTVDRETSAVMSAFGINTANSTETDKSGGDAAQNNSASNSQVNTQVQPTEKDKGATGKVFEIIKPDTKQTKVEQPTNQNQTQTEKKNEVDVEKLINETLGDSSANIKARLGKVKEYEELVNKSPYKSPVGEVFDDLVSKNIAPEVALRFITLDKSKLSHKEVMALAMQNERPEMGMEKINDYIDQTYKLGKYAEEGNETPGLTRLEFDVQPHLSQFDALKQKLLQNGQSRAGLEASRAESARIDSWKEPTKQIFSEFTKIDIPAPGGNLLRFKVEMDDAERNELVSEFGAMISAPGFTADEKGIERAKEALRSRYVAKHINEMALSFMQQGRSMSNEDWISLVHNPSITNTKGQQDFGAGKGDRDTALAQMILDAEGGGKRK